MLRDYEARPAEAPLDDEQKTLDAMITQGRVCLSTCICCLKDCSSTASAIATFWTNPQP
jgi:hypothetical protein